MEAFKISHAKCLVCTEHEDTNDFDTPMTQLFEFAYQCQLCNSLPEIFVIRRTGIKFRLDGRSPIEKLPVPKYLPKNQKSFYSDSLYAYNANKTLAAYLYLRTFIEQFMREETGFTTYESVDELNDIYKGNLDERFKARCPISLYSIYQTLSKYIHSAITPNEIYEEAKKQVNLYFREFQIFDEMKSNGIIT